ncbi:hypothetical protein [Allomesorhizobium camelthorni]|uniref:DUF1311 domain-containing protein n=1 Tax=Allomesorhizobium camelthorni TaxID=475069 RepID=A0A6G4WK08_9HYPH|nr:hypothetical protein [Mesorhizobium camelthorni]NGO54954.1 hypothetical protein [Mesorhizobium camelthorni]
MVKIQVSLLARWACMAALAFVMTPAVHAQPSGPADPEVPIHALKQVYLACEAMAAKGDLDTGEIMRCSVVYEELKRRAFNGDFKRLKVWANAQIAAAGY